MIKKTHFKLRRNSHIDWLKTYAENAKVNGFVVGISGGVDSAVTSTLCAQTGEIC
jgi:NAD+ synthase